MTIGYQVFLNGDNVLTPTGSAATGTAFALLDTTAEHVVYAITVDGLDFSKLLMASSGSTPDTADDVTAIHIHEGAPDAEGGVAFNVLADDDLTSSLNADGTWTLRGIWESEEGLDDYAAALGSTALGSPIDLYVNVHTEAFSGGEIRGQLIARTDDTANSVLGSIGSDTIHGLGGQDTLEGAGGDDSLIGGEGADVAVFSLPSSEAVVSRGQGDVAYEVLSALGEDSVATDVESYQFTDGTLTATEMGTLADSNQPRTHISELTGDAVLTPTGSEAFGAGFLQYTPGIDFVSWQLSVQGLDFGTRVPGFDNRLTTDTADDVTVAHIHAGAADATGGVVFDLLADDDLQAQQLTDGSTLLSGRWDMDEGLLAALPELATTEPGTDLNLYFNIHTQSFGGGEIRGQIVSATDGGADAVTGSKGNDTLSGLGGDDTLTGGAGRDELVGGTGTNVLTGGAGDDLYRVGSSTDTVTEAEGEGRDGVIAMLDSYTLTDHVEDLIVTGAQGSTATMTGTGNALDNEIRTFIGRQATLNGLGGNDKLTGWTGADMLNGGTGNDTMDGGDGANTLAGGADDDSYIVRSETDTVTEAEDEGTDRVITAIDGYQLDANVEELELIGDAVEAAGNDLDNLIIGNTAQAGILDGQEGDDTIRGGSEGDSLIGRDGEDRLEGGVGADSMFGNADNDTYLVDDAGDEVTEQENEGSFDKVISTLDGYTLGDHVEALALDGTAANGTGNELANEIDGSGTGVAKTLSGLAGDDTLLGGTGDDMLLGGEDDDRLVGSDGADTMDGGDGEDTAVIDVDLADTEVFGRPGGLRIVSADGFDNVLENVEFVEFNDRTLTYEEVAALIEVPRTHQSSLDGTQPTMPTGSAATGTAVLEYTPITAGSAAPAQLSYSLRVEGLDFGTRVPGSDARATEDTADDVTVAHIHDGARGANGGVAFDILADDDLTATLESDGSWLLEGIWDGDEGLRDYARAFGATPPGTELDLYFNIHTESFGGGEIRGQIVSSADATANTITGTDGQDTLPGREGADTISGAAGDDVIDGGAGADSMIGGLGDDTFAVDEAGDVIVEAENEGTDRAELSGSGHAYTLSDHVENGFTFGTGMNVTGNDLGNVINNRAPGTSNRFSGEGGNDTLSGNSGADTLIGGAGDDRLDGGGGADSMSGGADDDVYVVDDAGDAVIEAEDEGEDRVISRVDTYTLADNVETLILDGTTDATGNALDNVIVGNGTAPVVIRGLAGDDELSGPISVTDDTLIGGTGNDTLNGRGGADSMIGGADDDTYLVDDAGDEVIEAADEGTDGVVSSLDGYVLPDNVETLRLAGTAATGTGNAGANMLVGDETSGAKVLDGQGGDDTLIGGEDGDLLSGGDDDDSLVGGQGDDTLEGNAGTDTAKIDAARDEITVERTGDGLLITSDEGTDLVRDDVEFVELSDGTVSFAELGEKPEETRVQQIVIDQGQVTAPTGSAATGTGFSFYEAGGSSVVYSMTVTGLDFGTILPGFDARRTETATDDVTTAHIHTGARGENGGVAFAFLEDDDLRATLNDDGSWTMTGRWDEDEGFDAFASAFGTTPPGTDLDLYVNIHTTGFGGGEIRGQIVSSADGAANTVEGTSGNDTLLGLGGDDTLEGGAGDDLFDGGTGADRMVGGAGNDSFRVEQAGDTPVEEAGGGIDGVLSFLQAYTLGANVEGLTLAGDAASGTGNDLDNVLDGSLTERAKTLSGEGGDDTLTGGSGDDTLDGGAGDDEMSSGGGDDTYVLDSRDDQFQELAEGGADTIRSSVRVRLGDAEIERVELQGEERLLRIDGNAFATEMIGTDRGNILVGGGGGDTLEGGGGDDFFAFLRGDAPGTAVIRDFQDGDILALDDRLFGLGDGSLDLRQVTTKQIQAALKNGLAEYKRSTGELTVDEDGARGDDPGEVIALFEGTPRLSESDIFLF